MLETISAFLFAALALTGSPGPNTLSVAAVGASFGRLRGLGYMVGLNIGMLGVITIVATGLAGLVFALPGFAPVVTVLAAAYFLYLAFRIATAPPLSDARQTIAADAPRWYEGAGLSLVNPKAYAAMAALFSGHVVLQSNPLADTFAKAGLVMATIIVVNMTWLSVGAVMTKHLRDRRISRIVNIAFAILLLLSVAYAILA